MTDVQLHQTRTGIQDVALALRGRLQRYIESAYHLRDVTLVQERHALLEEPGTIAREPFLETTPSYELSVPYGKLRLPSPIGATLDELASWEPDMGVFPRPYRHQAEALVSFFADQRDLIVSTGTGSGKTETFLLPIVGSLLEEAAGRPASFRRPGFRALVLYPMNALVSDQIARLRRWLGDERLSALFRSRYGRHPRFGMYTSRTPYPGLRTSDKDKRYLDTLLKYYIDLENAAQQDKTKAQLIDELQRRGRWPAKDLRGFYGTSGGRWESRLLTQASDRELLTRHEMQLQCPDVLVTNYSMLEYMLMRPIEQPIFSQTRDWLASDSKNALILVVDEAHLYRGTAGAEVAYLIRRLQARLAIPRDRIRCILTSASLGPDATVQDDAVRFAHDLTGQPVPRSFHLVRGYREPRPPRRPGTQAEAVALATLDQQALANRAIDGKKLRHALTSFAQTMGWPAAAADADLPAYLYERLYGFGPIELLIAETTGQATALEKLSALLFPDSQPDIARRAVEALLSLGTYANNRQRPLLQTRVHMLFRGLPSLWACVNRTCAARRIDPQGEALLGRLYTEPRTQCECGARVYELLAHRDCGAVFLRAFGTDAQADFYWHEARGRLDHTSPLHEEWLILEQPHRDQEQKGLVYPIWMDVMTGRVITDPPEDAQSYRRLWRSGAQEQDQDGKARSEKTYPLKACPICTRKTPDKIADLATRGERPFANIVHEQFVSQPPSREFSEELPNGGRKVLLFADGRQKAARLARDLPREVEFDTFRQALTIAVDLLQSEGEEVTIGVKLYAAFVSVCHKLRLHFFDQEFGSQAQFLRHLRKFAQEYDAELAEVLYEEAPFGEFPMRYRQHLLDQLANPFYAVYHLGAIVAKPSASAIRRMRRELKALPEQICDQIELIATFWVQELLERGAFDKGIPEHVRERALLYPRPPKHGAALRDLEKVLKQVAALDDGQMQALRTCLYNVLTEQDEQGLAYLRPTDLTLHLAFDST